MFICQEQPCPNFKTLKWCTLRQRLLNYANGFLCKQLFKKKKKKKRDGNVFLRDFISWHKSNKSQTHPIYFAKARYLKGGGGGGYRDESLNGIPISKYAERFLFIQEVCNLKKESRKQWRGVKDGKEGEEGSELVPL